MMAFTLDLSRCGTRRSLLYLGTFVALMIVFLTRYMYWTSDFESWMPFKFDLFLSDMDAELESDKCINVLPNRTFLYLIQTERCIPLYLQSARVLGDPGACKCELLVLSFKSRCLSNRLDLPHVKYIFNSSTTWTTGRTLLYTTAMSREEKYKYYIFMDDDVHLQAKNRTDIIDPWRWFESLLLRAEPPLAAVDNPDWDLISRIHNMRVLKKCTLDAHSFSEYFPAVWFDAMLNAMHCKAIGHILEPVLPYWNKLDNTSWWFSQWYVNIMTDMAFHGQAILVGRVMTKNVFHRPYPRESHKARTLRSITNDIRMLIPIKYLNATEGLLKRWETKYVEIPATVNDTYCKLPPRPHPDLVPFKWAKGRH